VSWWHIGLIGLLLIAGAWVMFSVLWRQEQRIAPLVKTIIHSHIAATILVGSALIVAAIRTDNRPFGPEGEPRLYLVWLLCWLAMALVFGALKMSRNPLPK